MSASASAGLAAQMVREEIKVTQPTRLIATIATGASASGLSRALRATPAERVALVAEELSLGELAAPKVNGAVAIARHGDGGAGGEAIFHRRGQCSQCFATNSPRPNA
jgi:hypothetical protein